VLQEMRFVLQEMRFVLRGAAPLTATLRSWFRLVRGRYESTPSHLPAATPRGI
jgi:hypothetical protein